MCVCVWGGGGGGWAHTNHPPLHHLSSDPLSSSTQNELVELVGEGDGVVM